VEIDQDYLRTKTVGSGAFHEH